MAKGYGEQFQRNKKIAAERNLQTYGEYTCQICGRAPLIKGVGGQSDRLFTYDGSLLTIDHIVPISRGGKHGMYNLQVCCNVCNSQKGSK